jgi:hypothetical protein
MGKPYNLDAAETGIDAVVRLPAEKDFVNASEQGGSHERSVEIGKAHYHHTAQEIPSAGGGEDEGEKSGCGSQTF